MYFGPAIPAWAIGECPHHAALSEQEVDLMRYVIIGDNALHT
jgi:hypothetical protein